MAKITVEIDPRLQKLTRSPVYFVIAALTGVAPTFAPLALYQCGKGQMFGLEPVIAPLCFGMIFFVSGFYCLLGGALVRELRKKSD